MPPLLVLIIVIWLTPRALNEGAKNPLATTIALLIVAMWGLYFGKGGFAIR